MQNCRMDLLCTGTALVDSIIRGFDPLPVSPRGYRAQSGSLNVGGEAVNEAVAAAKLGLSDKQIAKGVSKLRPVEHRLQLTALRPGLTMIDDAFNANPAGAAEALRVLSSFPGRHIIVTPGFVEEGASEQQLNRELGTRIAKCADIAILVGRRHTQPIADGASAAGMPKDSIISVTSLDEAMQTISRISREGDTILFENDLPDNYNE